MIFLIEYDRASGATLRFTTFEENDRPRAERSRLDIEIDLNDKGIDHEVVLLDAADEAALRRTHERYFFKNHRDYFESLGDEFGTTDSVNESH